MDSAELAEIRCRYGGAQGTNDDVERLWWEVDRLRFELAGAKERTAVAREERQKYEELYWNLQLRKVPGGAI